MKKHKVCQISVIESIFIVVLFGMFMSYLSFDLPQNDTDYKYTIDSSLDAIYYSEQFRGIFMSESLSVDALSQNWSSVSAVLDEMYLNYEFILSNSTKSKTIFSCSGDNKYFSERIISIEDNENYEFRMIKLGVCY